MEPKKDFQNDVKKLIENEIVWVNLNLQGARQWGEAEPNPLEIPLGRLWQKKRVQNTERNGK